MCLDLHKSLHRTCRPNDRSRIRYKSAILRAGRLVSFYQGTPYKKAGVMKFDGPNVAKHSWHRDERKSYGFHCFSKVEHATALSYNRTHVILKVRVKGHLFSGTYRADKRLCDTWKEIEILAYARTKQKNRRGDRVKGPWIKFKKA